MSGFVPYVPSVNKVVTDIQKSQSLAGSIWGITTYYNPASYSNKLVNYRKFHSGLQRQGLKLVTLELAFGDSDFELHNEDADILIQKRTTSVLWHKERLMNIGLEALPPGCDKIVWLDADILFFDDDWVAKTCELLEKYVVIQPFSHVVRFPKGIYLPNDRDHEKIRKGDPEYHGFAYSYKSHSHVFKVKNSGLAWAGRRSVFRKHGFYDKLILGTGDRFMAGAFMGFRYTDDYGRFTQTMLDDQDQWIDRIYKIVQGSVYYQEGIIGHLFHGTLRNRKYHKRTNVLKKYAFDPFNDIVPDEEKIWKWASGKEDFHREVKEYFLSRREEDRDHPIIIISDWIHRKSMALKSKVYRWRIRFK